MLMRLQSVLGYDNLAPAMVLVPDSKTSSKASSEKRKNRDNTLHLVVGYSGSSRSQGALDLALWIAHQTRIASANPVVVHVVYVVDQARPETIENADHILWQARCLASEWRGALNAHLRIGDLATELSRVAEDLGAEVILLGCSQTQHPLIQGLVDQVPCPVLGLPSPGSFGSDTSSELTEIALAQ